MSPMCEDKPENCSFIEDHDNDSNDSKDDEQLQSLQSRTLRQFKTGEEYLYAMKEDLAEWLNNLYSLQLSADDFIERLETGVILCRHANNVLQTARKMQKTSPMVGVRIPEKDVVYRANVKPQTFQARDNMSNFISWCKALNIRECLLFETDDIVLRKNERSFILCLLEVARKGSQFGVIVPLLVQMEQEIDRELKSNDAQANSEQNTTNADQRETETTETQQNVTNGLKHLHQRV
ncbi:GAS2-like protein 1, partial [Leptotrombidium deliense]